MNQRLLIFFLTFYSFTSLIPSAVYSQCNFTVDPVDKNIGDVYRGSNTVFSLDIQDNYDGIYIYTVACTGANWAKADPREFVLEKAVNIQTVNIGGYIPYDDYFGAHTFEVSIQDKNNSNNYLILSVTYNVVEYWDPENY